MADQVSPSMPEPVTNIVLVGRTGNGKSATGNTLLGKKESTLNALQRIFEAQILDYFIVVFTGGDELEADGQTLDEYLGDGIPDFLTNVLRLCGGRKVLLDNRTENEEKKAEQLKQLLALVADVQKQTGGIPYTDKMHRTIKEANDKAREQERELESKNLAETEMAAMKEAIRVENEKTMNMMTLMVENTLKMTAESHQREIRQLTELFQQGQQDQQRQQGQQRQHNLLPLPGIRVECNIM